jgi:hypothetical protein
LDLLRDMLPEGNQVAESVYEAKKIICPLGIEVEEIDACKNNCVLFRGDYADLDKCPKCGCDRYKRKMMENAAEMQCSVGFLDPQVFTATVISHQPSTVTQAIKNAMKNDYVVGAYNTGGHWVTVIISMKYKEVWYLDSAKLFPGQKFTDVRYIVNWSVSCRFCSRIFNLLVFLIGIADHAGPLMSAWKK